ncbi:MAG: alpha/beta hydrolase-fold protein [Pirellulaceae bacterium]
MNARFEILRASIIVFCAMWTLIPRALEAQSEGDPVTIGTWREIESEVLGETRRLIISKPEGYDNPENRFPVLFVLDGDSHFHHTTGLVEYMAGNDVMPQMLVVAITNTDRTRDLTPAKDEEDPAFPGAGGADNFIKFLRDELVPFIDENYRTEPYRILVGHSFGGLFAIHTLVHEPELFNAYIAISPSLQWDDQKLVGQAEAFLHERPELACALYMTTGNEGGQLTGGVLKLAGVLREKCPAHFEWDQRIMEEETHGTVPYRSTRQGLDFVFADWGLRDPVPLYDSGGTAAIHRHYERAAAKFGMERPTPASAFIFLATKLMFDGRLEDARAVLEHDPGNFPPRAMLYSMIGKAWKDREKNDEAIECYTRALEINPAAEDARQALTELGVDVESLVTAVTVPVETLQKYAGTYTSAGNDVEVQLEDGALAVEFLGQPQEKLIPVSDSEFVVKTGLYRIEFDSDEQGQATQMTIRVVNGNDIVCPRKDENADEESD